MAGPPNKVTQAQLDADKKTVQNSVDTIVLSKFQ